MKKIRILIALFIICLILSGITAFPVEKELTFLVHSNLLDFLPNSIQDWMMTVYEGIRDTNKTYPFLAYGYDWLAYGHIVIALFFIPLLINPIKYEMNLNIGLIACIGIFPLSFICGEIRHIPVFHRFIDCLFGIIGGSLLLYIKFLIQKQAYNKITVSF